MENEKVKISHLKKAIWQSVRCYSKYNHLNPFKKEDGSIYMYERDEKQFEISVIEMCGVPHLKFGAKLLENIGFEDLPEYQQLAAEYNGLLPQNATVYTDEQNFIFEWSPGFDGEPYYKYAVITMMYITTFCSILEEQKNMIQLFIQDLKNNRLN
ncbi:MAG: hypothetical protein SCALA702_32400 [Melioribacteraceae bacterium]|nr:MAG: hypothetical protein SCALA702_32400 [Melioribacteraceae bacterium]